MTPFNETPEEKGRRLDRDAHWAIGLIVVVALAVIFSGIVGIARGIVWIRWAFGW